MEAQDCLVFKKGTSNAEKMTVAFWVKSNKTGTGQLTVKDSDNDRQVAGTYAISSANTWEHKVINLPADTSGAINNDNGAGFRFEWWLGAGSSYSGGAVPTAWEARADGDRGVSTLAINDNTANDWAITGIQVEVGEYSSTTLPPFQHESFADNLARCQRYFQLVSTMSGGTSNTTTAYVNPKLFTTLRAAASYSVEGALSMQDSETNLTQSSGHVTLHNGNETGAFLELQNFSSVTDNRPFLTRFLNNNKLKVDAEL